MQINSIQSTANKVERNKNNNRNHSFKGMGAVSVIDTISRGTADAIENGGLAVSFTLQDMLGTNLPRPIMGLMRNKKENQGQTNKKFAAKELVREFLTGPSMFIIPAGMLGIGKKALGKTVDVPMNFIKNFGKLHAEKMPKDSEQFFSEGFSEMLSNIHMDKSKIKDTASDFAKRLNDSVKDKEKLSQVISELGKEFTDIAKQNTVNPAIDNYTVATVKDASGSFKNVVKYMTSYADDVLPKAENLTKKGITDLASNKALTRLGMNVAMFGAVLGFLQLIPKLYNKAEGQENAGLKGLMKEETLGNSEKKSNKNAKNPSFGSDPTQVVEQLTKKNTLGKFINALEFDGLNMSFPMVGFAMFIGTLVPRIKNAKDKYDREEIIRRDVTACSVLLAGEKMLRKGFSKYNENKSGFVLAEKPKNFADKSKAERVLQYLRPVKGVRIMSTPEIVSKYSGFDNFKNGIADFCDFITGQNGSLSKIFSADKKSAKIVGGLLEENGLSLAKAENEQITKVLTNPENSDAVKKLTSLFFEPKIRPNEKLNSLAKTLKEKNIISENGKIYQKLSQATKTELNAWAQKAKTLNDRFTAFSVLLLVPVLLGFALPFINEKATKKKVKEENGLNQSNTLNSFNLYNPAFLNKDDKAKEIFSSFAK